MFAKIENKGLSLTGKHGYTNTKNHKDKYQKRFSLGHQTYMFVITVIAQSLCRCSCFLVERFSFSKTNKSKSKQKRTHLNCFSVMGFSSWQLFFQSIINIIKYYFFSCSILISLPHCTGWASWPITFYGTFMTIAQIRPHRFSQKHRKVCNTFYFHLWNTGTTFLAQLFILSRNNNRMCRLFPFKTFSIRGKRHAQLTMTYATSCCSLWATLPRLNQFLFVAFPTIITFFIVHNFLLN